MKKKNYILSFLISLFLLGCNSEKKREMTEEKLIENKTKENVLYTIINEEVNKTLKKTNLEVRLHKEITEAELKIIAYEIKNKRPNIDKFWIFYFLPEHSTNNGAWAISHFKPEPDIKILGTTTENTKEVENIKVEGKILNKWKDNDPLFPAFIYLIENNNELFIKEIYPKSNNLPNGGILDYKVTKIEYKEKIRFNYKNDFGEYFLIEDNGNLSHYNNDGKFKEAIPIKN